MRKYPFKFLDSYQKSDADIFFGRNEAIKALYEMVSQNNMVLVYGASGTGKTSLIQCGLASRFRSYDWLPVMVRRGNGINESLNQALDNLGDNSIEVSSDEDKKELTDLTRKIKGVYLNNFKTIYLVFDQFEELYTLGNKEEEGIFIDAVKEILASKYPVKIIFSMREEYLGHLYRFEQEIPRLLRKKLRVEPMTKDDLDQVLKGINRCKNSVLSFDKNTTDISKAISDKLQGDNRTLMVELPYLQVFMEKLYQTIANDKDHQTDIFITLDSVLGMGDIGDVLKNFLEDQVEEIRLLAINNKVAEDNISAEIIWKILSPFATLEGTKDPIVKEQVERRVYDLSVSKGLIDLCVEEFVKRRILNYSEETGRYELAHDSLARCIAGKRDPEEIKLLEVRRLINYQVSIKEGVRELFSEKQMKLIKPFLTQLKLTEEEGKLIEDSQSKLASEASKRRKRLYLVYSVVFFAVLGMVGLLYRQKMHDEEKVIKNKLAVLIENRNKAGEAGNYLQGFLYTAQALTFIKDKKLYDSVVRTAINGSFFSVYSLTYIFRDSDIINSASFSPDEKSVFTSSNNVAKQWQIGSENKYTIISNLSGEIIPDNSVFQKNKKYFFSFLDKDSLGFPLYLQGEHILTIDGVSFNKDTVKVLTWGKNTESFKTAVDFWDNEGINAQIPALVQDGIRGAVFSADNSMVLTWGTDSSARIWKYVYDSSIYRLPADLIKMKSQVETGLKVSEADNTTILAIPYLDYLVLREKFLKLYSGYLEKIKKKQSD